MHGVAYDATILALKIVGPNLDNLKDGEMPPEGGMSGSNVAPAIRYAVEKGTFVANLSMNGTASGTLADELRAAMDVVRQNDRLVVESVSNFTDENSFTGQISEALVGSDRANADWFLFAIGIDANGNPRSANGNAGPLADRMLAAVGNSLTAADRGGGTITVTGNSFAAPAVAGAAALLKQYWPQLGGKAISRILLDTATDAGAAGVDPIYGAGILNIEKAMQAQAPAAAFASAAAVVARFSSLTLSAPFGGAGSATALGNAIGGMTVLDRYGRDYAMRADAGVRGRGSALLAGGQVASMPTLWAPTPLNQSLAIAPSTTSGPWQASTSGRPAVMSFSPAPGQSVTLAGNMPIDQGQGIAGSMMRTTGATPVGITTAWSGGGWSAGFSSGRSRDRRSSLASMTLSSPVGIGVAFSSFQETGQALGLRGGAGLGIDGARTTLATVSARRAVGGFQFSARAMAGWTQVRGGSELMRFDGPVTSTAYEAEVGHPFARGIATVRLASPLRVQRARASLLVPISYDLMSGALATERRRSDLKPDAREQDVELGWSVRLASAASLRLGVVHAFDAGHIAGARDTAGYASLVIR